MSNRFDGTYFLCIDGNIREFQTNAYFRADSSQLETISTFSITTHKSIFELINNFHVSYCFGANSTDFQNPTKLCLNQPLYSNPDLIAVSGINTALLNKYIQIFVKTLSNMTLSITVDQDSTINDLKLLIFAKEEFPPYCQRLVRSCGEYSKDSKFDESLRDGDSITFLGRLNGGNPSDNPRIMPMPWWLGFACSYQDGRVGEEGRICNILSEVNFPSKVARKWYSHHRLSDWNGIKLLQSDDDVVEEIVELKLRNYQLTYLFDSIGCLKSLTQLFVERNLLRNLPESIGCLTCLTLFNVSHNQLIALPESFGNLTAMTYLSISGNNLTSLPDCIGNLTSLAHFYAFDNHLTQLPDSIGNLTSLAWFHVFRNDLVGLPESIGNLTSLAHFDASNNRMTSLPESIGRLSTLTELHLSYNQINVLPESFINLASLTQLWIVFNRLVNLPTLIGNLTLLTRLNVADNELEVLPNSIGDLRLLTWLNVAKNPITSTLAGRSEVRRRFERANLDMWI